MRFRSAFAGICGAALTALAVWLCVVGAVGRWFGDLPRASVAVRDDMTDESVLFDSDGTDSEDSDFVSLPADPVFVEDGTDREIFELAVTPEYFYALSERVGGEIPFEVQSVEFAEGAVILHGAATLSVLTERFGLPASAALFLPAQISCSLRCVPTAREGRFRVRIESVSSENPTLAPYLSRAEVLSAAEGAVNDALLAYLPPNYRMESVSVSPSEMTVRFRIE